LALNGLVCADVLLIQSTHSLSLLPRPRDTDSWS